jgi:hypothetical protein
MTTLHQSGAITPEQLLILRESTQRFAKVERAIGYARFNGWTATTIGAITLLTGFTTPSSLVLGVCLVSCGLFELSMRNALRKLDGSSLWKLAMNQVAIGAVVCGYCAFKMFTPSDLQAALPTGDMSVDKTVQSVTDMVGVILAAVYLGTAGLTLDRKSVV